MAFDFAELQSAISTTSDLYYVLREDGVFEFVNRAGLEFFETLLQDRAPLKSKTLVGANSRELELPLDWLAIHERGRHAALKTGESASYETPVTLAQQTYHYEFTFTSLTRSARGLQNVLVVGRDVTRYHQFAQEQQQQWQEECVRSRQQMQTIFQAFPDLVFRLSADGTYLEWHAQDLGYLYAPPNQLTGRHVREVLPVPVGERFYQLIQETLDQGRMSRHEYSLDVPNGTHHFEVRMVPLLPDQVLAIVRIISDRKCIEELLNRVVSGTAAVGGQAFFEALVQHIAIALNVRYVAVIAVSGDQANPLAFWSGDRLAILPSYSIQHTPCEQVIQQGQYQCTQNVQSGFPEDTALQDMGVESYLGYALTNAEQHPIGLLCIFDDKPFAPSLAAESMLKVFAVRATMELQRQWAEQALLQKAQQEQALNRVVQSIRNSLDLDTIFETAVAEVQQLLQLEAVAIIKYQSDHEQWQAIASYVSSLGGSAPQWVKTPCFSLNSEVVARLKQFDPIYSNSSPDQPALDAGVVLEYQDGTQMMVPLAKNGTVWGALSLVRSRDRPWDEVEVAIARAVADHLSIAIQQAGLYQQVQNLNTLLETQVRERTLQLEQALNFEDLLRRITDKVRDSLDEQTIFHATAKELADGLDLQLCNIVLYGGGTDRDDPIALVLQGAYSVRHLLQQPLLPSTHYPELYDQLTQGWSVQLCVEIEPGILGKDAEWVSILLCPIADDQGVIGDLLLLRDKTYSFSDREIGLVEQVASQCAIAVRQSRLYQATQAQVNELEFLNQIKDDFLSTVSSELRMPITNVKVASQILDIVLKQHDLDDPRIQRYMDVLQSQCQQEINLINDLLDLQELEAGTRSLNFIEVSLQKWLPRVVQPFLERIQSRDRTLMFEMASDLPLLTTDIASLQRILVELLHYFCACTPAGETIKIVVEAVLTDSGLPVLSPGRRVSYQLKAEAIILLSICSTGVEIPPVERPRIFDKFYRSIGIDRWRYEGTGLGLALVKRLTEHIGGTIELINEQNQACFLLELPITPKAKVRRNLAEAQQN